MTPDKRGKPRFASKPACYPPDPGTLSIMPLVLACIRLRMPWYQAAAARNSRTRASI